MNWVLGHFGHQKYCLNELLAIVHRCIMEAASSLLVSQLKAGIRGGQQFDCDEVAIVASEHQCVAARLLLSLIYQLDPLLTCDN